MTTDNISARLEKLKAEASTGFKMQIMKIYSSAEHPAFIPDSMVSEAVRVAEESASQFLRKTVLPGFCHIGGTGSLPSGS